jgi:hypothetical protein
MNLCKVKATEDISPEKRNEKYEFGSLVDAFNAFCESEKSHQVVTNENDVPIPRSYIRQSKIYRSQQRSFFREIWKGIARSPNECLEWEGTKDKYGYGIFQKRGQSFRAHRVAFMLAFGKIPKDKVIRHKCDNPACYNPHHLESGSQADNIRDRNQRNRQARGSKNGRAKLTEDIVADIRRRYIGTARQITEFAKEFQVSKTLVRDIIQFKTWRHVL